MRTTILKKAFGLFFVIVVLDTIAQIFYLHWTIWWYDVILHFLSGVVIGLTVLFVWSYFYEVTEAKQIKIIGLAVLTTFIIGGLWEIWEVHYGFTSLSDGIMYVRDTSSDLIIDLCGGFFGSLYAIRKLSINKTQING